MKRYTYIHIQALFIFVLLISTFGCSDSWLEPKPLSFYTPENTFVDARGMYGAISTCERHMRHEFFGDGCAMLTEMIQADIAVEGTTDKAGPQVNMDLALLPNEQLNHENYTRVGWYWYEGYKGIKYANTVISRIDNVQFAKEEERNAILGAAYFHRAYRYNKLTHQFGDVPFLEEEITSPKFDFYSYDRWSILERIKNEMEFAYKWVPAKVDRGRTSKAACGVLLMKICMALCDFDRAIQVGEEIIAANPLMTKRFTANASKPNTNLMFDLHSIEAKLDLANTEGLMYVVSYPETEGSAIIQTLRNGVPFWNSGNIRTPDGQPGTARSPKPEDLGTELDLMAKYGRGIGRLRTTWYYSHNIWSEKEKNDLRGIYNRDSWKHTSDLLYNNSSLKNDWYGKKIQKPVNMSPEDTIRCWYDWPQYKLFVPDPLNTEVKGGETPWYIYRTAEVHLMLAECYYWKNNLGKAAEAMNPVRVRAGAAPLSATDINIGEILNERARELYYEENRHSEIVRIAYIYAKTGKACEVFGGRVYKLENFSGPGGASSNIKQAGINFFWDWVNSRSNFYNKNVVHKWAEYKMSVHHVLWPVPSNAITTNTMGLINQNIGYPGAENNREPLVVTN